MFLFYNYSFFLFFFCTFTIYWLTPQKFRNGFLILASYYFYSSWSIKYLALIIFSTGINYFFSKKIYNNKKNNFKLAQKILWFAIASNLSILFIFKYFNFFITNVQIALANLGLHFSAYTLNIILPIGLSFYTFQAISYLVDIYRGATQPAKSLSSFALYITYFPQLLAGPIEQASRFIPIIEKKKYIKNIPWQSASYLFLYGLFQKIAISDQLLPLVKELLNKNNLAPESVLLGSYFFVFQMYCDFSGYSKMARGLSLALNLPLRVNFNLPLFANNPSDYWSRWHISLSQWIKTYLFIPLLTYTKKPYLALFISFSLMGLWHGASWIMLYWGIYWFILSALYSVLKKQNKLNIKISSVVQKIVLFQFVALGLLLYRSDSLNSFFLYLSYLKIETHKSVFLWGNYLSGLFAVGIVLLYEAFLYYKKDQEYILTTSFYAKTIFYLLLSFFSLLLIKPSVLSFHYFQI